MWYIQFKSDKNKRNAKILTKTNEKLHCNYSENMYFRWAIILSFKDLAAACKYIKPCHIL